MFLFINIMAASIDGFLRGILISGLKIKFGYKEFIKSFLIIFSCCLILSIATKYTFFIIGNKYIDIFGILIMIYLAVKSRLSEEKSDRPVNISAIALSVAVDAAVVSMYLSTEGFSPFYVSFLCALSHCMLLLLGNKLASTLIKKEWEKYTKYFSRRIFSFIAAYKIWEMVI